FVLDVDDALAAERDDRGDPHRLAELDITCRIHGKAVHDTDAEALGVERDLTSQREFADVPLRSSGAFASFAPRDLDVLRRHDTALGRRRRPEWTGYLGWWTGLRPVVVARRSPSGESAGEGCGLLERR